MLTAVVLAAYVSLGLELTVLHVPSVASSWKIWTRSAAVEQGYSATYRRVFGFPRALKAVLFVAPLAVVYGIYVYPLVVLMGWPDPLGDYAFSGSAATDVLAVSLIVVGRSITLHSVVSLRREQARAAEPGRVSTHGLFRHSRNPGLVGMYLFVVGLWLTAPSLSMLAGIVVYVLHMDFKVRMEEDYLLNRFGDSYRVYRRTTSRYWP